MRRLAFWPFVIAGMISIGPARVVCADVFPTRPTTTDEAFAIDKGTEAAKALEERHQALSGSIAYLPRNESQHGFLIALKCDVSGIIGSWVDFTQETDGSFDTWFAEHQIQTTTNSYPCGTGQGYYVTHQTNYLHFSFPMLTTTGVIAACGLPTNYLVVTPRIALAASPNGWAGIAGLVSRMVWTGKDAATGPDGFSSCGITNDATNTVYGYWETGTNGVFQKVAECTNGLPYGYRQKEVLYADGQTNMSQRYDYFLEGDFSYRDNCGTGVVAWFHTDDWATDREMTDREFLDRGGMTWWNNASSTFTSGDVWIDCNSGTLWDGGTRNMTAHFRELRGGDLHEEIELIKTNVVKSFACFTILSATASTNLSHSAELYLSVATPSGMPSTEKINMVENGCGLVGYNSAIFDCECGAMPYPDESSPIYSFPVTVTNTYSYPVFHTGLEITRSAPMKKAFSRTFYRAHSCFDDFKTEPDWTPDGTNDTEASGWAITGSPKLLQKWNVTDGFKYLVSP